MKKTNIKKVETNTVKASVRKWRIGEYIRQLSVVILGIVVTFVGGDIINKHSKHKEINAVMQLIKAELKSNQKILRGTQRMAEMEVKICEMLAAQKFEYENIPNDTLLKYIRPLNTLRYLEYNENSIEMLKNSSLMQHVSDKAFLLSLIQTYESLRGLSGTVSLFYDRHKDYWNLLSKEMTEADRDTMYKGIMNDNEIKEFYRIFLSFRITRDYVLNNRGFFAKDAFDKRYNQMEESIKAIEEKY